MRNFHKMTLLAAVAALLLTLGGADRLLAQATNSRSKAAPTSPAATEPANPDDTQQQLIQLLRMNPKLTSVVARDPQLLADQSYIQQNNPELEQFLQSHPEVVRSPDFYLFSNLGPGDREHRLQQELWPERVGNSSSFDWSDITPLLVLIIVVSALLWMVRVFLENRRWNRVFQVQSGMQAKLLERFGSSEDLLGFLRTDEGRRALELPSIPVALEHGIRSGSPVGRVLLSMQVGILLTLVGGGLLHLRLSFAPPSTEPLLVFGTLALMLGIGFIASAAISYGLARHLGLLPQNPAKPAGSSEQALDRR